MAHAPLSPLHEHGLPRGLDWKAVRPQVLAVVASMTYPPERVAFVGPDGDVRGCYNGDERAVYVPLQEMRHAYQAVVIHQHPPGAPPTLADVVLAIRAACPLFICLEGDNAHMVWVWSTCPPGYIAEVMLQFDDLACALRHVNGAWRIVPRESLASALEDVALQWYAFLASLGLASEPLAHPLRDEPAAPEPEEKTAPALVIDPAPRLAGEARRGVSYLLVRYLSRLRSEGRFAIRTAEDGSVTVELDGRQRAFASSADAWDWLRRAGQVGLERLFREG